MVDRDGLLARQRTLTRFGEFVLRCDNLQAVLTEACRLVAEALDADLAKVVEIEAAAQTGFVRAGVGWNDGIVGKTRFSLRGRSSEAFAIREGKPVFTRDISREKRFVFPPFMREHGVTAIVNVPIFLPGRLAYGLLQVDSRRPADFGDDDVEFLRTYAMVLGPVIDRLQKAGELEQASERFRLIVESAKDYAIFLTDPQDRIVDWLDGAAAIFGWSADEILGRSASILFTPEDRQNNEPEREVAEARARGAAPDVRWHLRKDGSRVFIDGQTVSLRHRNGRVRGFMKIGQDVTDRRRDEERQGVLLAELQHRVRNVLAMVRAIVARGSDVGSVAEFRALLDGRIAALTRTQTLLTRSAGVGIDLEGLIRDELAGQTAPEATYSVSGPRVTLAAKSAEILTLALHELSTNATKYGAFRQAGGRLTVHWRIELRGDADWLHLEWEETGVTIPDEPGRRRGFGTELVTRRVPYELNGEGRIDLAADRLTCRLAFPLIPGESILQTDAPALFRTPNTREQP